MAGRLARRAESASEPAARRSDIPPDSSRVRKLRRRRRSGRRRRARPRQPVRSGTRHGKESVRDRANSRRFGQPAAKGNRRSAAKAGPAGASARKNWPSSSATASKVPSSAGSRKCCAARPRNCSARWSRWRATTVRTEAPARSPVRSKVARREIPRQVVRDRPAHRGNRAALPGSPPRGQSGGAGKSGRSARAAGARPASPGNR